MRRERGCGERKGRLASVIFFLRLLAERADRQRQREGRRRVDQRVDRSGDGSLAQERQKRRDPERAVRPRPASAAVVARGCAREPAPQVERPHRIWSENGRTSTRLLDFTTLPLILRKKRLRGTVRVCARP